MLLLSCGSNWSNILLRCLFDFCFGRRSIREHQAAMTIQSRVRLIQARERRVQHQRSAVVIQKHARGFLVRYEQLMDKYGEDPISFKVLLPSLSVTTRCIHRFRRFALMHWLTKENNSCPLCRTEHPLYEPLLS